MGFDSRSIRNASNKIEIEIHDTRIELDEATKRMPGSPNIPKTILDKIETSDIFICDLPTINSKVAKGFKKVPNPNVPIDFLF